MIGAIDELLFDVIVGADLLRVKCPEDRIGTFCIFDEETELDVFVFEVVIVFVFIDERPVVFR